MSLLKFCPLSGTNHFTGVQWPLNQVASRNLVSQLRHAHAGSHRANCEHFPQAAGFRDASASWQAGTHWLCVARSTPGHVPLRVTVQRDCFSAVRR
jgi:hypothetical protein